MIDGLAAGPSVSEAALDEAEEVSAVASTSRIFKEVFDSSPSGMRIRLAHAMGKNRSFAARSRVRRTRCPCRSSTWIPFLKLSLPAGHENTRFCVPMRAPIRGGSASWRRRRAIGPSRCTCRILGSPSETEKSMRCCKKFARRLTAILQEEIDRAQAPRGGRDVVKKLMTPSIPCWRRSLDGFAAAHAGIVALGAGGICAPSTTNPDSRLDFRRRLRS